MYSEFEGNQINVFDLIDDNEYSCNLKQLSAINSIKEKEVIVSVKINKQSNIAIVTTEGNYKGTIIPQGNILNKFINNWKNNDYLINKDGKIISVHPYNYIR